MRRLLALAGPVSAATIAGAIALYLGTAGATPPRPTTTLAPPSVAVRAWAPFTWTDGGPTLYCVSSGAGLLYPPLLH